jgi:gliding motility-associated-like protein
VNQPPNAGTDGSSEICNIGTYGLTPLLSGSAQAGGTWSITSGDAEVSGSELQVDGLDAGPYGVRYTVEVVSCGSDAADFLIEVLDAVDVTDTTINCDEATLTYTVSINLQGGDPGSYSVTGLEGAIVEDVFLSSAIPISQGFTLLVTDANACAPRTIIGEAPCTFDVEVIVPESFTPNGDNINDFLVIPGIEAFPTNSIVIFNRWGAEVYSAVGYDNRSVRWDGTSTDALIPGDLPTGTYYYVLELGNEQEPYKGFIYLNR